MEVELTIEQQRALALARARIQLLKKERPNPADLGEPDFEKEARETLSSTPAERIAAHPLARLAHGVASPVLGASEVSLAPISPVLRAAELILGRPSNKELSDMQARGSQTLGHGMNLWGGGAEIAGNIASPVWKPLSKAIPARPGIAGSVTQGAKLGAIGGATTPGTTDEEKLRNAAFGLGLGGLFPLAVGGVERGWSLARAFMPTESGRAFRKENFYTEAAGDKADEILRLLDENRQIVPGSMPTAGEAASPAGRAEWSAIQASAARAAPSQYAQRVDEQSAAQLAHMRKIGKTDKELEAAIANRSEEAKDAYDRIRHLKVDPRSDVEIMESAIASRRASKGEALRDWGRFATTEAQNVTRGENFVPVPGMPRVSGRASNFPERAAEAEAAARDAMRIARERYGEEKFLENTLELLRETVGMGERGLQSFLRRPSIREAVKDAMLSAEEKGAYFPTNPGDKFSIGNLQRIKESLDTAVEVSQQAVKNGRRPDLSPQELSSTRDEFIKWLNNKSPEWRDARHAYAANSAPINRMQVGQYLEGVMTPTGYQAGAGTPLRQQQFLEAVRKSSEVAGDAAARRAADLFAKRAIGSPRFKELTEILEPKEVQAVADVAADFVRNRQYLEQAIKGQHAIPEMVAKHRIPNALLREVMVMNAIIAKSEARINERLAAEIAIEMLNPAKVAEGLRKGLSRQRSTEKVNRLVQVFNETVAARAAHTLPSTVEMVAE